MANYEAPLNAVKQIVEGNTQRVKQDLTPYLRQIDGSICLDVNQLMQNTKKPTATNALFNRCYEWAFLTGFNISLWKSNKVLYSFTTELEDELISNEELSSIPVDALSNLPFPSLYVEMHHEQFYGFFASLMSEDGKSKELVLTLVEKGQTPFSIPLKLVKNASLESCVDYHLRKSLWGAFKPEIHFAIQMLLYICAQNTQIVEDPRQKKRYKKRDENKLVKTSVRRFNAGEDYSIQYRRQQQARRRSTQKGDTEAGKGSAKSSHVRRGHWHHYWTGKRDSEQRKLIVRWVSPLVVNADGKEDQRITVIKEDRKKV